MVEIVLNHGLKKKSQCKLENYSWPLNNVEVQGTNPHSVESPGITFDSPNLKY